MLRTGICWSHRGTGCNDSPLSGHGLGCSQPGMPDCLQHPNQLTRSSNGNVLVFPCMYHKHLILPQWQCSCMRPADLTTARVLSGAHSSNSSELVQDCVPTDIQEIDALGSHHPLHGLRLPLAVRCLRQQGVGGNACLLILSLKRQRFVQLAQRPSCKSCIDLAQPALCDYVDDVRHVCGSSSQWWTGAKQ